jgi:thiol-disulfide isomerase/thioredoxin
LFWSPGGDYGYAENIVRGGLGPLRGTEGRFPGSSTGLHIVIVNHRTVVLAVVIGALAAPRPAAAADDKAKADAYEPKARQLLDEVVKAYKSLSTYSDNGELSFLIKVNDKQKSATSQRHITYSKPNKIALDFGLLQVVSDGKNVTGVIPSAKKYAVAPAPETLSEKTIAQMPLPGANGKMLFAGVDDGTTASIVLDMLLDDDPAKPLLEGTDGLRLEADRTVDDMKRHVLFLDQTDGPDFLLFVDPASKLLTRIEFVFDLNQVNAKFPKDEQVKDLQIAWSSGAIKQDVPKDAFAINPPADFTKEEPGKPDEERSQVEELVGKPAPDFTLNVLDAGGKTRSVSKADLAGKVVMIDFWATWCGPCLEELPEVQKMVDAFAKDKKNVVVVALSQDADPNEPAALRKLVEKTLDDHKLSLVGGPVSMVALDPEGTIGNSYKVEALPTVVIIDAKGIVQAAHVGYEGKVREILTKEIETLLAGKSLAKPVDAADKP